MKAFRAYFDFTDDNVAESRIKMSFGVSTGISNVASQAERGYHNLNGQRVAAPSHGIFIQNGKKVVIK